MMILNQNRKPEHPSGHALVVLCRPLTMYKLRYQFLLTLITQCQFRFTWTVKLFMLQPVLHRSATPCGY